MASPMRAAMLAVFPDAAAPGFAEARVMRSWTEKYAVMELNKEKD